MTPEALARENIDAQLEAAGWVIQNAKAIDLGAAPGVVVREFPGKTGPADYVLFIEGKVAGIIEAKAEGTTLSGVADQAARYQANLPDHLQRWCPEPPFLYESTGVETYFCDTRDPNHRSRSLLTFHTPQGLKELILEPTTFRGRLQDLPDLDLTNLRACQVEAIRGAEASLKQNKPRALLQMATGSGKTYTAVTLCYRLAKFARAKKILFLVDRRNLGRQAKNEFEQFVVPRDGRKFTELYPVQHLTHGALDPAAKVVITTIQRLYASLRGEEGPDDEAEEHSGFEADVRNQQPRDVTFNPAIPIDAFDLIIVDECHRSIYNLWRQVLEYFDAFLLGLTATPSAHTLGFFNQNLVSEYPHERAVVDGVNVGFEIYCIRTKITEQGAKVQAGTVVDRRDRLTRQKRWEQLKDDLPYEAGALDRSIVAKDQIRTVLATFKEKLFTDLFPGRALVPKTLVFAKDDNHAEDIVLMAREVFGEGDAFCKKITYRSKLSGEDPDTLLAEFRNSFYPRMAVTVDMIATGTDVRPLECLLFMRDVRSQLYYEQMKGRATRVLSPDELHSVTADAPAKTHFVLVDAVGVTETDKTDTRPLEREPTVPLEQLLLHVAQGDRSVDTLATLAGRLARLDRRATPEQAAQVPPVSAENGKGPGLKLLANRLLDACDPDKVQARARAQFSLANGAEPTDAQFQAARTAMADEAAKPFQRPALRERLVNLTRELEQVIDHVSRDQVLYAGFDVEKAKGLITSFKTFMEAHQDELLALQVLYQHRHKDRHLTFQAVKELAEALGRGKPPLAPDLLWSAYARLEAGRVKGAGSQRLLTDLISLVRFALGDRPELEPFRDEAERRFSAWLAQHQQSGQPFTSTQLDWLALFKERIQAASAIQVEDLDQAPFAQKGGPARAVQLFGPALRAILEELNEVLVA
ncbi:DEAD/DEAH box helicase family protein [Geothrix sp. 21YS21S-4]|uniref:type I restriction endonuclease subunit R n=1 Tax=Geothrix sp. 21YS21S-4 TaxID=3068889 RepID=UPI0027B9E0EC|nr:DEAD/DEAH box helicase family protein [Geothrix sp. 21YS21S-4]